MSTEARASPASPLSGFVILMLHQLDAMLLVNRIVEDECEFHYIVRFTIYKE
jgi:hypothetical protein